jgi:hypothetical protein
VAVSLGPVAVLEDLDADDQLEPGRGQQGAEVADDQPGGGRAALAQLGDGLCGDVQANEVQPGLAHGYEVAAVAAADVEAAAGVPGPGGVDDVAGEAGRRLAPVAAGRVLGVPGGGGPGVHGWKSARPGPPGRGRGRSAGAVQPGLFSRGGAGP